jgi:hypothetical protein
VILRAGLALLTGLTATATATADMLPLKRGIYVDVHVPCKGASNAATLSYWGGKNGINESKVRCTIKQLTETGGVYALQRTCQSIDADGTFEDGVTVKVLGRQSFMISGGHHLGERDQTYRYCGPKVQF